MLNDTKNWWECRNSEGRIGYVPKTILFDHSAKSGVGEPIFVNSGPQTPGYQPSTSNPSSAPTSSPWVNLNITILLFKYIEETDDDMQRERF